jgi:hypothetical protein
VAAFTCIGRAMQTMRYQRTDPARFDTYIHLAEPLGNNYMGPFHIGQLKMIHPRGPDPTAAFQAYKQVEEDKNHIARTTRKHNGNRKEEDFFRALGEDVAAEMDRRDETSKAQWLRQFVSETWGGDFNARSSNDDACISGSSEKSVPRKPMPTFKLSEKRAVVSDTGAW